MNPALTDIITELRNEGRLFSKRDLLVNISANSTKFVVIDEIKEELPIQLIRSSILNDARQSIRETGSNPLCWALGRVSVSTEENEFPLFLIPTTFEINSISGSVRFDFEESLLINPYLNVFLERKQMSLEKELMETLASGTITWNERDPNEELLTRIGLQIDPTFCALGNFHPHRYDHLRDLDALTKAASHSQPLKELLGEVGEQIAQFKLSDRLLFPADRDHLNGFEAVSTQNVSLLGPPGTGKSQFISNLIGKCLFGQYSMIVISEKRVALEVLQRKLQERNLDRFLFVYTHKNDKQHFVNRLKENWHFLEEYRCESKRSLELSQQHKSHLQLILDILNTPIVESLSISDFLALSSGKHTKGSYRSNPPQLNEFIEWRERLVEHFSNPSCNILRYIPQEAFAKGSAIDLLERCQLLLDELSSLNQLQPIHSKLDTERTMRKLAKAQIATSEIVIRHADIFNVNSRVNKQFLRLAKKFRLLQKKANSIELASHWKRTPHPAELEQLLKEIRHKGFKWRTKRTWKTLSNAHHEAAIELIRDELKQTEIRTKYQNLLNEFCELSIDRPDIEVELILQTWNLLSEEDWKEAEPLRRELDQLPADIHQRVEHVWKLIQKTLHVNDHDVLIDILMDLLDQSEYITSSWGFLENCSHNMIGYILNSDSYNHFEEDLFHSHWLNAITRFPALQNYSPQLLEELLSKIDAEQAKERVQFSDAILEQLAIRFDQLNLLLQSQPRKLSEPQREQRKKLKKGKSILVKEFSKKTRFRSIYELINSEASEWIQALLPVMLCSGDQLARTLPLKAEMYDLALFDESSQIPLFNALGAVQRSKRVLIAGDDQQMGPESSFSGISAQTRDLLTQGLYYFKRNELHHHYRSYSSDLIAFSNKHFYKDQLIAFPSYPDLRPYIQLHNCQGTYNDRTNKIEAEQIARSIALHLKNDLNFGVVAFSEEQLKCIYAQLEPRDQNELNLRIQENKAFFKSIEKVQGDECDHLIIGFTFAYDAEGHFRHQFGMMNTSSGRNRLNVLLTRARRSIHFYTSVHSGDFKLTANESIDLIRKWFQHIEVPFEEREQLQLPYNLKAQIKENKVRIRQIEKQLSNATDLINFYQVIRSRNWVLEFE